MWVTDLHDMTLAVKVVLNTNTTNQPILFFFNSLPSDRILDLSKLKAFTDDKVNVNENLKTVFGRVENIVGKGENAGYQHFLLFPQCFQKASFSRSLKVGIVR